MDVNGEVILQVRLSVVGGSIRKNIFRLQARYRRSYEVRHPREDSRLLVFMRLYMTVLTMKLIRENGIPHIAGSLAFKDASEKIITRT